MFHIRHMPEEQRKHREGNYKFCLGQCGKEGFTSNYLNSLTKKDWKKIFLCVCLGVGFSMYPNVLI